jgi:hypothetical protein
VNCCDDYGRCTQGKSCPCRMSKVAPCKPHQSEVGNVWFAEIEPEPLSRADIAGMVAVFAACTAVVIFGFAGLYFKFH